MNSGGGDGGGGGQVERQAAALAFLPSSKPVRFVLITSRRTRRWIFPKGGIEPGLSGPETAEMEAREEAGVIGRAESTPIGSYRSRKIRAHGTWALEIDLFVVAIREIRDSWLESDERTRRFVTIAEARELLRDPHMLRLAERFARR